MKVSNLNKTGYATDAFGRVVAEPGAPKRVEAADLGDVVVDIGGENDGANPASAARIAQLKEVIRKGEYPYDFKFIADSLVSDLKSILGR